MRKLRGFTLIELMVAVSVMAILLTIGISFYSNVVQKSARDAKKRADIDAIAKVYETKFPTENKYIALTADDFANKLIPTPPEGGKYQCFAGPDTGPDIICKLPSTSDGFKVCATLADDTRYCRSSTQGSLASKFDLATFFGNPPQFVNASSPVAVTADLPLWINKPANVSQNDLLLAHIAVQRSNLSSFPGDISAPAGWTLIRILNRPFIANQACSQHVKSATYWKIAGDATSDPGPYQWSTSSPILIGGAIVAYRGADTNNPIHKEAGKITDLPTISYSTPLVDITLHNTMIVTFFTNCANWAWAKPVDMNERYDYGQSSFFPSISGDDVVQLTPAIGVFKTAITQISFDNIGTAQIVVIKP